MNRYKTLSAVTVLLLALPGAAALGASAATADTTASSGNVGFLEDYSLLQPAPDSSLTKYYMAPGASTELRSYHSIMVDQPEVFISPDSPYKGFKPSNLAVVSDAFRDAVVQALQDDYTVVTAAGEGVLLLRLALVDVDITKNRVHIVGYTPAGLVFRAADEAVSSQYTNAVRHTSLRGVSIEGEVRDSKSSNLLGEFVDDFDGQSSTVSWSALQKELQDFGVVVDCQLRNARSEDAARVDCRAPAPGNNSGNNSGTTSGN